MIFLLRKIRHELMQKNKFTTYVIYAIGEIFLLVIGILIAMSLNNLNENRKNNIREIQYLKNIKLDLQKDLANLELLTSFREDKAKGTRDLLNHMNGIPIEDLDELGYSVMVSMMDRVFTPNNTTFSELSNSGNLNLISNDSIKTLLLDLENQYKLNNQSIEHETFDYREYISKPTVAEMDFEQLLPVYLGNKTAQEMGVMRTDFDLLLQNKTYKNGLNITSFMSLAFIQIYEEIAATSSKLIEIIDRELEE